MALTHQPGPDAAGAQRADRAVPAGRWARATSHGLRLGLQRFALPVLTTLGLLGLWEGLARAGTLTSAVPPFSSVISWIWNELTVGTFWLAFGQTVWHWSAGLVAGGLIGMILGVVIGAIPLIQRLLNVPLELLRPIPALVYLPVLILIMGSRSQTAILLAGVGAFWPMMFQTVYGVHAIDRHAIETGKVFGLTPRQRLVKIMFPSLLPYLATGVRIASSLALVVAVSIELVGGVAGLGAQLEDASQNALYPAMYGILLVTGVLGLILNLVLEHVEKRLLHWHVSHRGVS